MNVESEGNEEEVMAMPVIHLGKELSKTENKQDRWCH
jgi:hypothetical protein